jgi:arylsulfatase
MSVQVESKPGPHGVPGDISRDRGGRPVPRRRPVRARGIAVLALAVLACGVPESRTPPTRHLVLVTVDTLRADRLGSYGNPLELTPHLDALASESVVFRHAFAPAPFTLASLSALLTGRYPDALGVRSNRAVVPSPVVTLAEHLRALGFRTGAVVSNFVARRQSGLDQGFERYDDRMEQRETRRLMPERRAAATTADALAMLDELRESGERVFLWAHYQDPHGPYTAPPDYRAPPGPPPAGVRDRRLPVFPPRHVGLGGLPDYQVLGSERHSAVYRAAYHAEIRFLDAQLGALFEGLRTRGLWDETALAVTADHGEGLGEHRHWFAHGELVAPAETAVPLLLRVPGRPAAVRDDLASLLDLLPTLLAMVGAPPAEPASAEAPGRDLLARGAEGRESALFQSNMQEGMTERRAILRDGHQYVVIRARKGGEQARIRRLDGSKANDTERLSRLRSELLEQEAELAKGPPEVRQDLDERERAALEALGYVVDP